MPPVRVLFLCTGNRVRSQLAEGWGRALAPPGVEVWSAGSKPNPLGIHPTAIEVMRECGVDISGQRTKHIDELPGEADYIITLCAEADAECPTLPARRERLAWHLPDPDKAGTDPETVRAFFRDIRDEIERRVREFYTSPRFGRA